MIVILFAISSCAKESDDIRNILPTASFTIEETKLYSGQEISFIDYSSDQDGEIVGWEWDFGDDNVSEEQNPVHVYNAEGEYTVTLQVQDNDNGIDLLSKKIVVLPAVNNSSLRIKIMTFNVHRGESASGVFNLDAIADVIKAHDPDYVALQEVDLNTVRNGKIDMAKVLGEKTNMNYCFGRAIYYQEGEYGNAILSKNNIDSEDNFVLPSINEERAALRISSKLAGSQSFSFVSTHLDYGEDNNSNTARINAAKRINDEFAINEIPAIIAGDFNDTPASECIAVLKEKWNFADTNNNPTFPSTNPVKKIDYIAFYPASRWTVVDVKVINTSASDHNPLLLTVDFNKVN
ncbi:endonuclease/exonuclease/phosphatase family protein [uncultured Draconibacterium sp.]|uniref:endonuclease/exonuclease/phosphatase family protein n=1 Tax=uncultured Draconibacterium sp. TaxID=1573823 RepID=UPI0029C932DD|nr:endonuclease/exonuclease/phosphatase family protein [uncultured Draconibacterium sp.]